MKYSSSVIYHFYNQSNNFEPIFRSEENYLFFLRKIRKHLLPVADVLCYCLMPDHFHFLIKPTEFGCTASPSKQYARLGAEEEGMNFQQQLSHEWKTILSSYTKAFNRRYNRRGSLFRAGTKAKPGYMDFADADLLQEEEVPFTRFIPYLRTCFHYIHDNPVKAHYALTPEEWPFSSASDYAGLRHGTLCNYDLTEQLLGISKK